MLNALSFSEQAMAFCLLALLIYLAVTALGRLLKRRARLHLGFMYQLLAAALALYLPMHLLGWNPGYPTLHVQRELGSATVLLAVIFGIAILRRYLWEFYYAEKRGIEIPKFVRQILACLIFCVALLVVLYQAYGVHDTGVVLTSTVVVGVVGWAMQDLLGNVISGVSLQVGKPFTAGDWLIVENYHAEVIEVNWRSTRLRTTDDHYLDVPNTQIVRGTIVNLSYPSVLHAMRMRVGVTYAAPPNSVKKVLLGSATDVEGVLRTPKPTVYMVDFADSAVTYEVKYWIDNHARYNEISDAIRTNIWYCLRRAGMGIPFPIRTVQIERVKTQDHSISEETKAVIRSKPFFQCLSPEQILRIVHAARFSMYGVGEDIVEQGADGTSMFVLEAGTAEVLVSQGGDGSRPARVATLQTGDHFGEMSLLTGEKRSATVRAITDCEVLEIAKAHLAPMLQENAELMRNLSEMLARRRLENEGVLASTAEKAGMEERREEYAAGFLAKLASFFEL